MVSSFYLQPLSILLHHIQSCREHGADELRLFWGSGTKSAEKLLISLILTAGMILAEEIMGRDIQRLTDGGENREARRFQSAFDLAQIDGIYAAKLGKFSAGETPLPAGGMDSAA